MKIDKARFVGIEKSELFFVNLIQLFYKKNSSLMNFVAAGIFWINLNLHCSIHGSFVLLFGVLKRVKKLWEKDINVYFISGMCYNCSVFDKIVLPEGYKKKYIEWHVPIPGQSLREYVSVMAKEIDTSSP